MLSLVTPEKRVPEDHPLRQVKGLAEDALRTLSPVFEQMYSSVGRPSIPPERLLKATLLMALYTVRSDLFIDGPTSAELAIPEKKSASPLGANRPMHVLRCAYEA